MLRLYHDLVDGVDYILPAWLPIARFRRRDRARAGLQAMLGAFIKERVNKKQAPNDGSQRYIPKGWLSILSPPVAHPMSAVFTNPANFDPGRFLPVRDGGRGARNWVIGFGLGPHACLGRAFARRELKIVLNILFERYTLDISGPISEVDGKHFTRRPATPGRVY